MNRKVVASISVIFIVLFASFAYLLTESNSKNAILIEENTLILEAQNKIEEENMELKANLSKLEGENLELKQQFDFLKDKYDREKLPSDITIGMLKDMGIDDYKIILNDLENHRDLIGYEGVLGGTMNFFAEGSILLNERYVLAYFEDGHIGGYALLQYSIDKEKNISWEVIDSYLF